MTEREGQVITRANDEGDLERVLPLLKCFDAVKFPQT